jgi:hypothetical protein
MQWLRDTGWIVAGVLAVGLLFLLPKPAKLPNNDELDALRAMIAKHKAESAERQAAHAKEIAKIRADSTLRGLQLVGEAYREHLAAEKKPPAEADFADVKDLWTSNRDHKPFVIVYGADLAKLPGGGIGHVLAWEQTADAEDNRCVLLADGKTAKVMPDAEFQKLPKAK